MGVEISTGTSSIQWSLTVATADDSATRVGNSLRALQPTVTSLWSGIAASWFAKGVGNT